MKILVIRFSSMGDVILITPVLSFIRDTYKDAEVVLVTDKSYAEFFQDDPRLSTIIGVHKDEDYSTMSIAGEQWDFVIDLQNNKRSKRLLTSLKKRKKTGTLNKYHLQRFLLLFFRYDTYPQRNGIVSRYLKAAGYSGSADKSDPGPKLFFNNHLLPKYTKSIQVGGIHRPSIALFPFSAWKNKEWPIRYFKLVGRFFIAKGWNVLIMGSKSEYEKAQQLCSLIGVRCSNLCGKYSLYELGCILSNCSMALGNDSGLSHLARACGIKTGILYGPTSRQLGFYPSGAPAFRIFEEEMICRPCHPHGGDFCMRLDHKCMRSIMPEKVIKDLLQLFHEG